MNQGAVEGLSKSKSPEKLSDKFLKAVRHSNEVFSAFKVHAMGKAMQAKLLDRKGKLRPFEDWKKLVAPIASHHTGAWLRTEYNTAVIRAHQGADWQDFIANKDVLPNLRWMPTTSPTPEGTHKTFWERRLTLPVDDPFWATQHPGNRWNCKCALDATDDPVSDDAGDFREEAEPTAQRGLGTNPKDGTLIDDKHPYFPEKCNACPYYQKSRKGLKGMLKALFENKKKDCSKCSYIAQVFQGVDALDRFKRHKALYKELSRDPEYTDVEFDKKTGALMATHISHNEKDPKKEQTFFGGLTSSDLEKECQREVFRMGKSLILLNEKVIGKDKNYLSCLDCHLEGKLMDIRSITSNRRHFGGSLTGKNTQLAKYNKREDVIEPADSLCLYFHDPSMFSEKKIERSLNYYRYSRTTTGTPIKKRIKHLYVVVLGADDVKVYDV
ncbi:MAG: phage minor head protein [Porphyromonas sp.]|nr:phage minor head protein [Porphyromonas sp.]